VRSSEETPLILLGWIWIWIQVGKYDEDMYFFEMLIALFLGFETSSVDAVPDSQALNPDPVTGFFCC
jgi:hypothetical protein